MRACNVVAGFLHQAHFPLLARSSFPKGYHIISPQCQPEPHIGVGRWGNLILSALWLRMGCFEGLLGYQASVRRLQLGQMQLEDAKDEIFLERSQRKNNNLHRNHYN